MESGNPDHNADDPPGKRPQKEEKKDGSHGQIGNLQDPAEDQTSDAQLNQGQGNPGSQQQAGQPGNASDAASNNPQSSRKPSDIEREDDEG